MIRSIIMLFLFSTSWNIFAMEIEKFTELNSIGVYSACTGKCYTRETSFNAVSSTNQRFWTFQDPVMDCTISTTLYDFPEAYSDLLLDNSALKAHSCSVIRKGEYFSNILITKFELNPKNNLPQRALETFLLQLISQNKAGIIYVWINPNDKEEANLLGLLINKYDFKKSEEILFLPSNDTKIDLPHINTIQLEVDKKDLKDIFN